MACDPFKIHICFKYIFWNYYNDHHLTAICLQHIEEDRVCKLQSQNVQLFRLASPICITSFSNLQNSMQHPTPTFSTQKSTLTTPKPTTNSTNYPRSTIKQRLTKSTQSTPNNINNHHNLLISCDSNSNQTSLNHQQPQNHQTVKD